MLLTLTRKALFTSQALTRNQRSVAGALDSSPSNSALVLAVSNQTGTGAREAFDSLSGEIHASTATTLVNDALYMREAVLGRLRQASVADATGPTAALGLGGPTLAYADHRDAAFPIDAPPSGIAQTSDITWWSQGVSAWGRINGDGDAANVRRNLAGFFTGVDRKFGDNWLAGVASGYSNSSVGVSARSSSAGIDTVHFAAYANASYDALNFRSGAAFAWNTISTSRSIQFPGFVDSATAHYGAGAGQVFGEVGYVRALGDVAVEPFAGLAYVHLDTDSFTEVGQAAALAGSRITENVGYSSLGLRLATSVALDNGVTLSPHVSAYWQHAFNDITPTAALTFMSTGATFTIAGVPLALDAAVIESGIDLWLGPNAKVGLSYFGELDAHFQDNAFKGNFTWNF